MLADPEVLPLITSTAQAFSQAVGQGIGKRPMPAAMRSMLEQNVFIFSGFKTHAELSAVSALLIDESGKKKPFERFARDVQAINENYNLNYLRAEYNFATQSARSAAMWAQYQADADSFYLQYRTAADERVRESHALLHGTTLPVDDPFWQKFFPPNGWNCRCTVVQVRKSKYPLSDSKHAIELGEKATTAINKHGQNKLAIFRFNPGQDQKIFPPRHPYLPKPSQLGCKDCQKNMLSYNPNNPMCQACMAISRCIAQSQERMKFTLETYENGGIIESYPMVPTETLDYNRILESAKFFAKQGSHVVITPKFDSPKNCPAYDEIYGSLKGSEYYGKCPDLWIDGRWFEHEGFISQNYKRAWNNMIKHGTKQSNYLIFEKPDLSGTWLQRSLFNHLSNGSGIEELWLKEGETLKLFYKKKIEP